MAYEMRYLDEASNHNVYLTFVEAFADYALDMSYMNEEIFKNRSIKNGIDYESSVGVYDKGRLVGYTLIGLDIYDHRLSAFDIGTGIIKSYRGQGIARKMFEFALPRLKEKGVKRFILEVLQDNEAAIRAYKKSGFRVVRSFDCYQMHFDDYQSSKKNADNIDILDINRNQIDRCLEFIDWHPSWENSFSSMHRIPDTVICLGAVYEDRLIGALVYYPALNWIMCVVVEKHFRRRGVATLLIDQLIDRIQQDVVMVKLINVQSTDTGMRCFLENNGFEIYVRQYEMACHFKNCDEDMHFLSGMLPIW